MAERPAALDANVVVRTTAEFAHFQQQAALWKWDSLLHAPFAPDIKAEQLPANLPPVNPSR